MTRLYWKKDPLSGDLYAGPFIAKKDKYLAFIGIGKYLSVYLVSDKKEIHLPMRFTSVKSAKAAAKNELIKLGVNFYDEVRHGNATTKS